jgi:hypothetical protein
MPSRSLNRERFGTALSTLLAVLCLVGCNRSPPSPVDLSKTPWLDPNVQREGLKNQDFRVRGLSAFHLGNMGASAIEAVSELEKLAKDDPHPKVRENAVEALTKIRGATQPLSR